MTCLCTLCHVICHPQASELSATVAELATLNGVLQQQVAAAQQAEAQVQQLQAKLLEAEQLRNLVEQLTAENAQVGCVRVYLASS